MRILVGSIAAGARVTDQMEQQPGSCGIGRDWLSGAAARAEWLCGWPSGAAAQAVTPRAIDRMERPLGLAALG